MKKFGIFLLILLLVAGGVFVYRRVKRNQEGKPPAAAPAPQGKKAAPPSPIQLNKGLTRDEEKKFGTNSKEFDTDHDGLSDYAEIHVWHTDPTKFDTDGDGYGDGFEVLHGYNPLGSGKLKP